MEVRARGLTCKFVFLKGKVRPKGLLQQFQQIRSDIQLSELCPLQRF